jgi:teichuronic acid biosynthesis glycosyltransferase TuaC
MREKTLFVVDVNCNEKAGMFNAIHIRIKNSKSFDVVNIGYHDSKVVAFIRNAVFRKKTQKKSSFSFESIDYQLVSYKRDLLFYLYKILRFDTLNFKRYSKFILSSEVIDINKYSTISAHWGVTAGILAKELSLIGSIKYAITLHGSDIHTIPKKNHKIKKLLVSALNNSSVNFFVSQALYEESKSLGYVGDNYYITTNGVDTELFNNIKGTKRHRDLREKFSPDKNKKIIGFVGNLNEIKNAHLLPEIQKQLSSFDCMFILLGDGPLRCYLEENMDMGRTTITGRLEHQQVVKYMQLFDLLILPSQNEGLPLVLAESLSCGTIALASDVGGISEILEDDFLVKVNSDQFSKRFALGIIRLLDNAHEAKLDKKFHWSQILKNEADRFRKI